MLTLVNRFKSDEALMRAYQRGDTAAFECLYHRHKDGLFAFLYRSCQRHAVVEELAQDAWMGVINTAANYRREALFKTWLYQIAHNRLVDFWRRKDNHNSGLDNIPEPVTSTVPQDQEERSRQLMAAIGQLPGEQRDALLLQEQGFSQQDIAEITRCGEETVKSRLRYARKQLRQQLGGTA
jgi:RNA polymerase sigma-70 factor (ECF subfamily)